MVASWARAKAEAPVPPVHQWARKGLTAAGKAAGLGACLLSLLRTLHGKALSIVLYECGSILQTRSTRE